MLSMDAVAVNTLSSMLTLGGGRRVPARYSLNSRSRARPRLSHSTSARTSELSASTVTTVSRSISRMTTLSVVCFSFDTVIRGLAAHPASVTSSTRSAAVRQIIFLIDNFPY